MFGSPRERRWWLASGLYFAAILATLYPAQLLLLALRERGWLGPSIQLLFAASAGVVLAKLVAARPGWREVAAVSVAALLYLLLLGRMTILQERLHVLEYGLLALLFHAALAERRRTAPNPGGSWRVPVGAALLTGLAGWGDELVQAALPNRVYDLRDVAFNALAGTLAVLTLTVCRAARARDTRARR